MRRRCYGRIHSAFGSHRCDAEGVIRMPDGTFRCRSCFERETLTEAPAVDAPDLTSFAPESDCG